MDVGSVEILVDHEMVRGRLYVPKSGDKQIGVLFIHGWTGKPNEAAASVLVQNGYTVFTISLRGHNNSDGDIHKVSRKNSLDDAVAAYDYLLSKLKPRSTVVLVGSSYGSYISVMLSGERAVKALSIRVPAGYPNEGFDLAQWGRGSEDPVIAAWRKTAVHFADNAAFQRLHDFKGPVQIIEAGKDDLVPAQTIANYVEAISDKSKLDYHLMKDWPHSLGDNIQNNKQFQVILLSWLNGLS